MSASVGPVSRIDHYLLERRLALGGMAEVFLARDERSGRQVALKRLLPQVASDQDFLDRFFHEIQIQIALKHHNIVELLDCSPDPARPYIVMEYVDGGSLHSLRAEVGKVPWEITVFAALEAAQGLALAHRKGIVHRDVKPHNLMWTREGVVKLADFGISHAAHMTRLTMTGTVVGTPGNMSPEQARGEALDGRSDLFSLGVTIYELVAGFNPFAADSVAATLRRVVEAEPEPPSLLDPTLPPALDGLLPRLLAKDKGGRWATADEAVRAMRELLAQEGIGAPQELFRDFVAAPKVFVAERRERLALESRQRAEELLADRAAPPEEALWAAYRTISCAPDDPAAQTLFRAAADRAGQRPGPVENAKIRELEAELRKDPGNVGILLQLAKLYRLERDFVNVMRFFRKLQAIAPADPYTQGQIAALVSGGGAAAPASRTRVITPAPPEPPGFPRRTALVAAGISLAAALAFAVWWSRRPSLDLNVASAEERARAERVAGLLRPSPAAAPPSAPSGAPKQETLQRTLERAALVEKESGPRQALALCREQVGGLFAPGERASLLFTMAELAERAGDSKEAASLLDEAGALGPASRGPAALRKAALFGRTGQTDAAVRLWGELSLDPDREIARPASLQLAMALARAGDGVRALTLYEEILARAPDSAEANPARLGAAALYRAQGRAASARRLYEEVRRTAPPGSDFEKSAASGLRTLEEAAP